MNTSNAPYKFDIRTNKAEQRIVVIDDLLKNENYEPIDYYDFDAVIFTTTDTKLLYKQFTVICSPFTNNAFQFKPMFFNPKITERPLISSADGLADNINSQVVIDETIRIKSRMEELGFKIFFTTPDFWNSDRQFYAFCRHCLSRAIRMPAMEIVKGSPFGYLHPILYVMLQGLELSPVVFLDVRTKLLEEFKYMKLEDLVAIVHVCPKCFDKGLIYHETCPKCGSIDIAEQNMLHHFRCANISPEHTYMKNGTLICPKCLRELRHIGVDYDRPTTTFNCNKCGINFSNAKMVCECESCLTKSNIENLAPVPLYNIKITKLGEKIFPTTNDFTYSDDIAKFNNVLTLNQFKDVLRIRLHIYSHMSSDFDYLMRVYRTTLKSEDSMTQCGKKIVKKIYKQQPQAMVTVKGTEIFVAVETKGLETQADIAKQINEVLGDEITQHILDVDYIQYEPGYDFEKFFEQL